MPRECWGPVLLPGPGPASQAPSGFPLPGTVQLCHGKGRLCLSCVTPQQQSVTSALPCHPETAAGWARGWPGQQVCC